MGIPPILLIAPKKPRDIYRGLLFYGCLVQWSGEKERLENEQGTLSWWLQRCSESRVIISCSWAFVNCCAGSVSVTRWFWSSSLVAFHRWFYCWVLRGTLLQVPPHLLYIHSDIDISISWCGMKGECDHSAPPLTHVAGGVPCVVSGHHYAMSGQSDVCSPGGKITHTTQGVIIQLSL